MNSNPAAGRGSNGNKNRQPRNPGVTSANPRGSGLPLRYLLLSTKIVYLFGFYKQFL